MLCSKIPLLVIVIDVGVIIVINFVVIVFLWWLHWNNVGKVNVPISTWVVLCSTLLQHQENLDTEKCPAGGEAFAVQY